MKINHIYHGDCLFELSNLPDKSVDCCVTSPPYFGLRDYNVDGQIGLEETPEAFIANLVAVFAQVRRVLKPEGTLWVNIGDSYWGGKGKSGSQGLEQQQLRSKAGLSFTSPESNKVGGHGKVRPTDRKHPNIKPKDLIGIPWMLAFALRADGWYLRQECIWSKPNPMPESVTDRCTKSHESIFLLSKSHKYHFDYEAIKEPVTASTIARLSQDLESQEGSDRVPGKTNGAMKAVGAGRPQLKRAIELAEQKGLTEAHFDAIRSVGLSDAGRAKLLQSGSGKNSEEVIRLAEEAKAALGGYYREFVSVSKSGNKERKNGSDRGCPEGSGSNVCGSVPWEGSFRNKRSVWSVATKPYSEAHFATFPPELIIDCIKVSCPVGGIVLDPSTLLHT